MQGESIFHAREDCAWSDRSQHAKMALHPMGRRTQAWPVRLARVFGLLLCAAFLAGSEPSPGQGKHSAQAADAAPIPRKINWAKAHHPDTLLIRFKPSLPLKSRATAHAQAGAKTVHAYRKVPLDVVRIEPGKDLQDVASAYAARPDVDYVEPNYLWTADSAPQ